MTYLTYEEYSNMGGVLDSTAFNRHIDRACLMINNRTQSRLKDFADTPYEVKCLCRDLVEYISEYTVNKTTTVTSRSQSVGAVNESESYAIKSAEDFANDLERLFEEYLPEVKTKNGVSVLYRGAMS